jgi:hypothetical protein
MTRYFIKPAVSVLPWLLSHDEQPHVLPVFPDDETHGLVVAHLLSGGVFAEVIPSPRHIPEACGEGLPLGRLYFQIPKSLLYTACENLHPKDFGGSAM